MGVRFAGSFPGVMTVLSGMKVMEHLQDNLRTYAPLQPLTDEEFDFLQQTATLMVQYRTIPLQRLQILYALPLWVGHSGDSAALQQVSERGRHHR